MEFKEIAPESINDNVFSMIGSQWMLIAAEKEGKVNAMTASWGGMGVLWGKNVSYIFIRPQRFTKEFVDSADMFSLSFFDKNYKKMLSYFGSVSGRDEDKIKKAGLTVKSYKDSESCVSTPYFAEANLSVLCKKLYASPIVPDGFVQKDLIDKNYPTEDYHTIYVGEIVKLLSK